MKPYILPLSDPQADLETVGGKGMSLAKLINAQLPVPAGFHVTTEAYRLFVQANNLQAGIHQALQAVDISIPANLETASAAIVGLFTRAEIPAELAGAIVQAYATLPGSSPAVAVRSSATAEDLPGASFAGQQETYLNISGADKVLEATRKCWASLWTARAISYRARQHISPDSVALAVVVQLLVNAEAAGILFTANPLTGHRDEIVINAAWGLGEAIVGGGVTPDTIIVNKSKGKVIHRDTAEKLVMTVRTASGTAEQPVPDSLRKIPVLSDEQAAQLAGIGVEIEKLYGTPMDIEWTLADGKFAIVQARPVTALPEMPLLWTPPDPKGVYMRTSVADLMPEPLSPLFVSWGIPTLIKQMYPLGERMTHSRPVLQEDYYAVINQYVYMNATFPAKAWWWIITGMLPAYPDMLRKAAPIWREELVPEYRALVDKYREKIPAGMSARDLIQDARQILDAAMYYVTGLLFATMGVSAGSEGFFTQVYNKMVRREGDPDATVLLMGWDNIPGRAEKSLYDLAMWCREHGELASTLLETPSARFYTQLQSDQAPDGVAAKDWSELQKRVNRHLEQFGYIIFQLDFAAPLPLDNPAPMLENIKMYLRGEGTNPHERQKKSAEKRISTTETMRSRLKGIKRWIFNKALNWGQSMAEVREDALAEIGIGYPILRSMLHELGRRLVDAGVIEQVGDIFWLEKDEVDSCVTGLEGGGRLENLSVHVEQRKAFNEKANRETPPPMMPMKKKFMGINTSVWLAESESNHAGMILKGVATSSGKVTAAARVLHSPEDFDQMRPGEVLVAGTTTPAWTPLFAMASAVVTDIGGPLSHGSIVAREYGIPAVMGTGVATRRIHSGQVITVDGTKGEVILETADESQSDQIAPPLEWVLPHPKALLARGSFAEFVPEPVSPLFATLAVPIAHEATLALMGGLGMTEKNSYLFAVLNDYVYVGIIFTPKVAWQFIRLSLKMAGPIIKTARKRSEEARGRFLKVVQTWQDREPAALTPVEILTGVREIFTETALFYNMAQSATIPTSMTSELAFSSFYKLLVKRKSDPKAEVFVFGSENQAVRAEKALYDLAMWVKEQPEMADFVACAPAEDVCQLLDAVQQPDPIKGEFAARFNTYLGEYGHTIYDLDFAKPTPAEAPASLVETLKIYLAGTRNPYERQRAAQELRETAAGVIARRLDPLRRKYFLKLLKWAQDSAHLREDSIADMGLGHPQIRRMLGELGCRLTVAGAIADPDDIFWLEAQELDELASRLATGEALQSFGAAVEKRKAKWEAMRHIVPPNTLPKVSWLSRFYANNEQTGSKIKGFGASAGKVTGRACVMLGPEDFDKMQPGDVLVAGITTPAWTSLFARASAIVTDIGGPLSHSSIVAREYGIPAVLATGVGTRRIQDGQTVTVDGNAGIVMLE